jgi:hypothetical protein
MLVQSTAAHKAWLDNLLLYIDDGKMLTSPPAIAGE